MPPGQHGGLLWPQELAWAGAQDRRVSPSQPAGSGEETLLAREKGAGTAKRAGGKKGLGVAAGGARKGRKTLCDQSLADDEDDEGNFVL